MNTVIFCGRLTKDPETRYTQDKKAISKFSLAVDRRYKVEGKPSCDFFNCSTFGKLAEFVSKYLVKGTKIILEGEIQNNNYTDAKGVNHYNVQIIARNIEFAESKKNTTQSNTSPQEASTGFMQVDESISDDEIPFA